MKAFPKPHPYIRGLLDSPATSFWLKDALRACLERDPVDAYHDAQTLTEAMRRRLNTILPGDGDSQPDGCRLISDTGQPD